MNIKSNDILYETHLTVNMSNDNLLPSEKSYRIQLNITPKEDMDTKHGKKVNREITQDNTNEGPVGKFFSLIAQGYIFMTDGRSWLICQM